MQLATNCIESYEDSQICRYRHAFRIIELLKVWVVHIEERWSNGRWLGTGTPLCMAPEILKEEPYKLNSDIWSLGIVIFELCTLEPYSLHFWISVYKGIHLTPRHMQNKQYNMMYMHALHNVCSEGVLAWSSRIDRCPRNQLTPTPQSIDMYSIHSYL